MKLPQFEFAFHVWLQCLASNIIDFWEDSTLLRIFVEKKIHRNTFKFMTKLVDNFIVPHEVNIFKFHATIQKVRRTLQAIII